MNKFFTFLFVAVLFTVIVEAQVPARDVYIISGQVVDSLNNEPVPYATVGVAFEQMPAQFVNAAACDGNGKFEVQLKAPGAYVMTIQSVGTTTLVRPFTLTEADKKTDFGKLFVQEKAETISEVTVSAQRPLVKVEIDKLIYNMEEDPEAKVNNTLEMLRKVPLLTVDGDDKVQLKGSSNFKIYLNGKPSNMLSGQNVSDVLKSMPANTIKNIEVITDPGARYDAEGISGIINIVTSRNVFQGYQGSVSANAGTLGRYGGSAYLTAKTGKLGLTGNFSYNNYRSPWSNQESVSENFNNDLYYMENTTGRSKSNGIYMFGRLEASYEFDTLRLLSLGVDLYNGQSKSISERLTEMFNKSEGQEYSYERDGNGGYNYGQTGINLDYQRSTRKKDENLTFSYRYNHMPDGSENRSFTNNISGNIPPYFNLTQWYNNDAKTVEHTGQIDYFNPLTKAHSIETGIKYILRQNISNVKQYALDTNENWVEMPPNVLNDFEHTSNIFAGYMGYAFKAEKFGFRTGLRAEGTRQEVKFRWDENRNFNTDYFNLVPSVTVSYQLKQTQQLRVGYNLRIYRPGIWSLNPYVNDVDPNNISYGNPNLEPEKANSFNLNYSSFSSKLTLNISTDYSYVNNAIEGYTFIDPAKPDVKQTTYGNIGRSRRASMYVNTGWTPTRALRLNINGGLIHSDMRSAELDASNSGLTGNCYINAQLTLPKDFRISAYWQYLSGWVMLQGKQSGYNVTGLGLNKDFLKKKLTVSLMCTSPFSSDLQMKYSIFNNYFVRNYTSYQPIREGRISISYRFGTLKEAIKKVQRGITNDDVKGGESGGGGVGM